MTTIKNITCKTLVRPMRTTFATSRGSKTDVTSVIVKVIGSDGATGVGEVPTSFGIPHETAKVINRNIRRAAKWLCGQPVSEWSSLAAELRTFLPDFHMTCSGLETAMFRAWLASVGSNEKLFWGGKLDTVTSDITIPFVPEIETLTPWVRRAVGSGFGTYKIKVSGGIAQDVAFVRSIMRLLSETETPYTIRLDGNQGFNCDSALRLLDRLPDQIELFEQPLKCDDYQGMKQLCQKSPVPIIADETVFSIEDCRRVIEENLAHGINIKIAKSGITQSRQIIDLAKKAHLKLMIGCMTETMIGLSAAIYCAAGTAQFDYIDLDSVHFLNHRKKYRDIVIDGPTYLLGAET